MKKYEYVSPADVFLDAFQKPKDVFAKIDIIRQTIDDERPELWNATGAFKAFYPYFHSDMETRERVFAILLDKGNKANAVFEVGTGGIGCCNVDVQILLAATLATLSSGIILAHNHPSGRLRPSEEDKVMTEKIRVAAKFFNIQLIDHLILVDCDYFSFADEGLL